MEGLMAATELSLKDCRTGAGKRIAGAAADGGVLRSPNLMFPAATEASQERVDTGTPVFCPVVVVSQGSSLNHSS